MKTIDFGKHNRGDGEVTEESGELSDGDEVLVRWVMPDGATGGKFAVTQPQQNGDARITTVFLGRKQGPAIPGMTFQFGSAAIVPGPQSATAKVEGATNGLLFKLTIWGAKKR